MRGSLQQMRSSLRHERDAIRRAEIRGGSRRTARRRAYNDGVRRLRLRGGVDEKGLLFAAGNGDAGKVERLLARRSRSGPGER